MNREKGAALVVSWVFWAVMAVVSLGALVALAMKQMPILLRALFWLGALGLMGWSVVGRQVILVDVMDDEVTYEYWYRVPFLSASYTHDEVSYDIVNQAQYAVLNLSEETMVLTRAGGTWPFGVYTVDPMVIEVRSGEVAQLPGQIRPASKRGASYFTILRKRVPDNASVRAVDLLDRSVAKQDWETIWPEVYYQKKRVVEWLGQAHVGDAVAEQLGRLSDDAFTDVFIAFDPQKERLLWGFNFEPGSEVKSALLVFSMTFQWVETRSSDEPFFGFNETCLDHQVAEAHPDVVYLFRAF